VFADGVVPYFKSSHINLSAINGYPALAQRDSKHDGQVNSQDANFNQLRVWRDLNQDGISEAGGLSVLAQQGIASIKLLANHSNVNLPKQRRGCEVGNTLKWTRVLTRLDSSKHSGLRSKVTTNSPNRHWGSL
jgi:hypothetical protein